MVSGMLDEDPRLPSQHEEGGRGGWGREGDSHGRRSGGQGGCLLGGGGLGVRGEAPALAVESVVDQLFQLHPSAGRGSGGSAWQ